MQRVWRALSRHENGASKYENKDTRDSWAARYDFDVGAWHAAQAGLWEMMGRYHLVENCSLVADLKGSSSLVELHEDMVMERVQDGRDGRLTVTLAKAAKVSPRERKHSADGQAVKRGRTDEALAILFDMSTIEGITMAEYHRWSRAVWSTLHAQLKHTYDLQSCKTRISR